MNEPILLIVTMMLVGQIALCISVLIAKKQNLTSKVSLIAFLLANGVVAFEPVFSQWGREQYTLYVSVVFPALFLLNPALQLYIESITFGQLLRLKNIPYRQSALFLIGLLISILCMSLSEEQRQSIFILGTAADTGLPLVVVLLLFFALMFWIMDCILTLYQLTKRLMAYHKKLKDILSNTNQQTHSTQGALALGIASWVSAFVLMILSSLFEQSHYAEVVKVTLYLILIWSIAMFGILHASSINPTELTEIDGLTDDDASVKNRHRYQRSALGQEQAKRLEEKLDRAMMEDKLYLNSSLTLQKLAQHLSVSPNYISQTLNETMEVNFFDFVNRWRVIAAKERLKNSSDTVSDIALAVGFNARSSFYKAFKQETGETPNGYRKSLR
ncbi:AraC family transcriptional regulator [Pleionea sp. CnH1-48]|uniref:helix-turn-helix domain-containing protein n=1 Tax=Pleionea sp. CnH1-48 TaxID=2954494 RepID=UPI00209790EB|nr:AraC family transcriptional regulator [Pleionea sp. CnH1-48]MCO7224302.1 AraC family transcriptional regulator [Pleionea sp. CnH1-48]